MLIDFICRVIDSFFTFAAFFKRSNISIGFHVVTCRYNWRHTMHKTLGSFLGVIGLLCCAILLSGVLLAGEKNSSSRSSYYSALDNGSSLPENVVVDSITVYKSAHIMVVFNKGVALKKYVVHLGVNSVGPKECSGDLKTPEGLYSINFKNPASKFHKSLGISYPNANDLQRAYRLGKAPGGDIMIHGLPNGEENVGPDRYTNDWTWGCVAVRNTEIDELFDHVEVGTPLLIVP